MSTFVTWDEVAEYVTNSVGYDYLTNPKSWIDTFKDVVGDSRWIGVEGETGGGFIGDTYDWVNVGKPVAPTIETGVKTPPSVTNVITDLTTGGAVAGESALAVEQVGITIELSAAGWLATGLVGLGLGVASYEVFPEFWTDVSNYVFGTELTPQQTEPFLRKKIKTLLSTDTVDGKPVTYLPEDFMVKLYDFVKEHVTDIGINNTFPTAGINPVTGYIEQNPTQVMDYMEETYISKEEIQTFVNSVAETLRGVGYTNIQNLDVTDFYTELQASADLSGYDLIALQFTGSWSLWNNGFINTDPSYGGINTFGFNAYRLTEEEKSRVVLLKKARKFNTNSTGFITAISPSVNKSPSLSASYTIYSPPNSGEPIMSSDIKNNGSVANYMREDNNQGYGSLQRYVGIYPVPINGEDTQYYGDNINGFLSYPDQYYFAYTNPLHEEKYETDEYLGDKAKITGKAPDKNKTYQERYQERQNNNKKIAQPTKEGADNVATYTPATAPIGSVNTNNIINNGVNFDDNSYNENQDDNITGKNTPNKSNIDDLNDSIEDSVNSYNDSKVSPETAPHEAPETQPLPKYPTTPPTEPDGDSGDTPDPTVMVGVTASGMCSVYNPTKAELIAFSGYLWSNNFLDNFMKIFQNPMDAIIGLHIMYATPITTTPSNIIVGYLDSGVSAKVVNQQFSEIDCGSVNIPEYYGNAIDYEPYTQVHCYLPFIGIVSLKPNDVIGKRLQIKYGVDALTGTCLAILTTYKDGSEIAVYNFAGNCATQIPISGGNYAQMITGLAGFLASGVGAVVTGNPLMALGAGASLLNSHLDVAHSGSIGANAGAMGIRKPYLIITRKKAYNAQNYQNFYGFPSNNHVKLIDCKGYTQVKSCHVESIYRATDNEKKEIESLLKQGVIII